MMSAPPDVRPSSFLISDADWWPKTPHERRSEIHIWMLMNGIRPADVCTDRPLTVERGSGEGWFIHFWAYLRDSAGFLYAGADGESAVEDRYVPMEIDPPMWWMR